MQEDWGRAKTLSLAAVGQFAGQALRLAASASARASPVHPACPSPPAPLTGDEVAHRLLRGHQHLAAQVPALLLGRQLVLKVHCQVKRGGRRRGKT